MNSSQRKIKCNISIKLVFGVFLIAIFLTGCATRVPVTKTKIIKVPEFVLNQKDSTPLAKEGLSIKIKPILGKDINQFSAFTDTLHYSGSKMETKYKMEMVYSERFGRKMAQKVPYKKRVQYDGNFNIPLFPLPAFEVSITNNTDKVIKFTNATIAMEDSNGNLFDVLGKQDISSYLREAIKVNLAKNRIPHNATITNRDQLFAGQKQVKLIDNNFKVLPGRTTKGYLVFNYGKFTIGDFRTFVLTQDRLDVQLYELPIKVDKAANVLETTSFSVVFDIKIHEKEEQYIVYEWQRN